MFDRELARTELTRKLIKSEWRWAGGSPSGRNRMVEYRGMVGGQSTGHGRWFAHVINEDREVLSRSPEMESEKEANAWFRREVDAILAAEVSVANG